MLLTLGDLQVNNNVPSNARRNVVQAGLKSPHIPDDWDDDDEEEEEVDSQRIWETAYATLL